LQQQAEVAVVGGGCVGTSTTYHLARLGCRDIALFEQGHALASGATGKSSAIVNAGIWNASRPLVQMLVESIEVFNNFDQRIGGRSGFTRTGWIGVTGEIHANRVRKVSNLEKELGVHTSLISPSEVKQREPGIFADDLVVAVYESRSGYANPVDTTISFASNAEKLGATIKTSVKVTGITVEGNHVTGIKTANGTINAKKVVVACNVWSPKLLTDIGVTLPIVPTRKQVCLFKPTNDKDRPKVVMDDFVNDLYMKPEGEQILVGEIETPGLPVDPEDFVETIDYDTTPKLAGKLLHRFPAMSTAAAEEDMLDPTMCHQMGIQFWTQFQDTMDSIVR